MIPHLVKEHLGLVLNISGKLTRKKLCIPSKRDNKLITELG